MIRQVNTYIVSCDICFTKEIVHAEDKYQVHYFVPTWKNIDITGGELETKLLCPKCQEKYK